MTVSDRQNLVEFIHTGHPGRADAYVRVFIDAVGRGANDESRFCVVEVVPLDRNASMLANAAALPQAKFFNSKRARRGAQRRREMIPWEIGVATGGSTTLIPRVSHPSRRLQPFLTKVGLETGLSP